MAMFLHSWPRHPISYQDMRLEAPSIQSTPTWRAAGHEVAQLLSAELGAEMPITGFSPAATVAGRSYGESRPVGRADLRHLWECRAMADKCPD